MPLPLGACPPLPTNSISLNGSDSDAVERYKIRELCEGFPCHRDACEWPKMRALFAEDEAYVFTTWSGGVPVDDFMKISQAGFEKGVAIAHRANGCTVDLATSGPFAGRRALGKLKATITQRFDMPVQGKEGETCQVDVEADCRLCFFVEKRAGEWKCHFFKGIYEKDRAVPVDPRKVPSFDDDQLSEMPAGYRYLAYAQTVFAGANVKRDLPQLRGSDHDHFYECFKLWLEGADLERMKKELGV